MASRHAPVCLYDIETLRSYKVWVSLKTNTLQLDYRVVFCLFYHQLTELRRVALRPPQGALSLDPSGDNLSLDLLTDLDPPEPSNPPTYMYARQHHSSWDAVTGVVDPTFPIRNVRFDCRFSA